MRDLFAPPSEILTATNSRVLNCSLKHKSVHYSYTHLIKLLPCEDRLWKSWTRLKVNTTRPHISANNARVNLLVAESCQGIPLEVWIGLIWLRIRAPCHPRPRPAKTITLALTQALTTSWQLQNWLQLYSRTRTEEILATTMLLFKVFKYLIKIK